MDCRYWFLITLFVVTGANAGVSNGKWTPTPSGWWRQSGAYSGTQWGWDDPVTGSPHPVSTTPYRASTSDGVIGSGSTWTGVPNGSGGVTVSSGYRVPVGKTVVPVVAKVTLPKSGIVAASLKALKAAAVVGKASGPITAAWAVAAGIEWLLESGTWVNNSGSSTVLYRYAANNDMGQCASVGWRNSPSELADAVHAACAPFGNTGVTCGSTSCTWTYGESGQGGPSDMVIQEYCPAGYTQNGQNCVYSGEGVPPVSPISEQQAESQAAGAPMPDPVGQANENAAAGQPMDSENPQTEGPAQVPGDSTRHTNPDGSSTVSNTVNNITYNNNTMTTSTITTTNYYDSQGALTGSETEESTPEKNECELEPNTLKCIDPGSEATSKDIQEQEIPINFSPSSLGEGSCPSPAVVNTHAMGSIEISYQPVCDFANGIKYIVIALGWLTAGYIFMGVVRE